MLAALVVALIAAVGWPETAAGRWLHRWLVAAPARRLEGLTRRHLIFALLLIVAVGAGSEYLAMAGPLDGGLVLLWDVAAYVDLAGAALLVAVLARTRGGWALLRARCTRRPRARSARRPRSTLADDPEPRWRPAFA